LLLWLHSELCGQSSNFEGRKINNQDWYFNKCQVPKVIYLMIIVTL